MKNIEAPAGAREVVTFKDDKRALVISAEKAKSDAKVFRWIVGVLEKGDFPDRVKEDVQRAIRALNSTAEQFDEVAGDNRPQEAA